MWRIIFCAVVLVVCSGQPLEDNPTTPEKDKDPTPMVVIQESPTPLPPSIATAATPTEPPQLIAEVTKPLPETETPAAALPPVELEEGNDVNTNRRTVTYDQRQDGQYNIRADLENFMIVLIPPSPMDGVSLLDLLSKSTKRTKSHHKKYHHDGSKYRQSLKSGANSQNINFFGRHHPQALQASPHIIVEEQPSARISEFIEGRTPYRVDISSTSSDLDQFQQQYQPQHPHGPQVDVLPPPYPLSYHHLIKPFHLEAEPTVIQALPPQSITNSGKFMDANGNFFRMARALPGGELYSLLSIDANGANGVQQRRASFNEQLFSALSGDNDNDDDDDEEEVGEGRSIDLPLASDSLDEAIHNYVYPPLNPLRYNPGIFDVHSRSMQTDYPKYNEEANAKTTEIELKLLGATEECGPDRKRDSYGICRFAEGY